MRASLARFRLDLACAALVASLFLLSFPTLVSAQSAAVLGLRSVDGDDDFAAALTQKVRSAAGQYTEWQVSDAEVSLAQMALAHGCEDPDARCLADIAGTLSVDRVIYGSVRRTALTEEYDFRVTLYVFNRESGRIEGSVTDTVPRGEDEFSVRARRYVEQLAGVRSVGVLRVRANAMGAEVFGNGELLGITGDDGVLEAEVSSGDIALEIRAEGREPFRMDARAVLNETVEIDVDLNEVTVSTTPGPVNDDGPGLSTMKILGWTGVGSGAVLLGLTAYSWVHINSLNNDAAIQERRADFTADQNICDEDRSKLVQDWCSESSTYETLQWVFLGAGVLTAGVGIFLLSRDDEPERGVAIVPSVGPYHAGVAAAGRF